MGVTYQAFDESLRRDVAIKIFSKNMTRNQINIENMVNEARKAAALSHPHIVPIYSIGSADGAPYIVMELLSDDLIYNKVCKGEALDERFTLEVGLSICKALCEANKKQLLHLDVKPANILTDSNGVAKLIDFGLACQMHDPLKGWGTCLYMPPERLTRKGQDWKSDQYSLGISLWRMLAGKAPFTETDVPKLSKIILSEAPPILTTLKPELHEWTAGLIYKMMAYKAEDRYQSYPKLIKSFETVLDAL
ncbi:MAG: serine/threonine protein kinase [Verrucomicrobiales bacterium]|nr:serine/threonine protein kinase [Verrucomicrobiales bacterium]